METHLKIEHLAHLALAKNKTKIEMARELLDYKGKFDAGQVYVLDREYLRRLHLDLTNLEEIGMWNAK
jgi:hypothetical protein